MSLKAPSLSISSTSLTNPSTSVRLQQHKHPILSLHYPTSIQLPKTLFTLHTSHSHHFLQFCSSASSLDNFQDYEDESEDFYDESEEEEEEELEEPPVAAEGSRLYIGNLPYAMTSSELSDIFEEAGRVVSVQVVYHKVTGRSRGFGFVTMQTVEDAKEAIRMYNGALVGGRIVKVNFPEVPRGGERAVMGPKIRSSNIGFVDSPYKIYAGNLSWIITSQGLRDAFKDQPGLLGAKVIYERETGRSRGFGFITFGSMNEAESALEAMNGVEVGGRQLRLNLAVASASTETKSEPDSEDGVNAMQSNVTMSN